MVRLPMGVAKELKCIEEFSRPSGNRWACLAHLCQQVPGKQRTFFMAKFAERASLTLTLKAKGHD